MIFIMKKVKNQLNLIYMLMINILLNLMVDSIFHMIKQAGTIEIIF
jgi:hypothetical protein